MLDVPTSDFARNSLWEPSMSHKTVSVPRHPGSLLRLTLEHLDCTKAAAARFLGLSRQTLYEIIAEKQAITPGVALPVAKLTGTSAEKWLNMQQARELAIARVHCRNLL